MTTTYVKGAGQAPRLGQRSHSPSKTAPAPSKASDALDGRIGTTLGAHRPASLPKRDIVREQRLGLSSQISAATSINAGVASGSEITSAPSLVELDHRGALSPVPSTAKLQNVLNFHSKTLNSPATDAAYPGWLRVLILFTGIAITYGAIFALTAFALSVMS